MTDARDSEDARDSIRVTLLATAGFCESRLGKCQVNPRALNCAMSASLKCSHPAFRRGMGGAIRGPRRQTVAPPTLTRPQTDAPSVRPIHGRSLAAGKCRAADSELATQNKADQLYVNFTGFPFPLGPLLFRRTVRYEVAKGSVWTFEQEQSLGFTNVTTNTRMTVVKLASGGLWVHAPIAPTKECLSLLKELDAPVEHIVLPTFAYEHKIFMAPFSRKFPRAQTWVAPGQWSWPVNLPLPFFGVFKSKVLGRDEAAWQDEIDFKVLLAPSIAPGLAKFVSFPEVAFLHRKSKSLLLTDSVIYLPSNPPEVIRTENLLNAATDNIIVRLSMKLVSGVDISGYDLVDEVDDSAEARRAGWRRMALQVIFFGPENIYDPTESFEAVSNRLVVSPIVRKLVYNKVPEDVREWVDYIATQWKFTQIIPCHFAGPIKAGPRDFRQAFDWLESESAEFSRGTQAALPEPAVPQTGLQLPAWLTPFSPTLRGSGMSVSQKKYFQFPEADLKLLNGLNDILLRLGIFKKNK